MTVINGIEIDDIYIRHDEIRDAIINNDPIDTTLHVIMVLSNPCQYARRYILAREFIARMEEVVNITLYVVELAYGTHKFHVTNPKSKRHLQIHADVPLWHKENMINMGTKLLPTSWKAMAWIDADVEFENPHWSTDCLKILNGSKDVVQLFSHAIDMNMAQDAMNIFPSFGYQYAKKREYGRSSINMWHPGFAWAVTRKAYEKMGSLFELSILGAGDHNMAFSLIGEPLKSLNELTTDDYKDAVTQFGKRVRGLRLAYVPGIIRHYFHGSKKNRKYADRWMILVEHGYQPSFFVTKREDGLLVPTKECPPQMLEKILQYFAERNEDEGLQS